MSAPLSFWYNNSMRQILKKPLGVLNNLYLRLKIVRHVYKKQIVFVFGGLCFIFFALIPTHYARAEVVTILVGIGIVAGISVVATLASKVTSFVVDTATKALSVLILVNAAVVFIIATGAAHMEIGSWMFHWAISNPFGISMTNPASNPIIQIGWTVTRDLTNMFFILGLAYIGLATALNISGFNTKKTFAKLLLFALLINFTPVICGVIVDAANIITDFFFSSIDLTTLFKAFTSQDASIGKITKEALRDPLEFLIKLGLFSLYAFLTGTVLWLFALIFLMRHLIIWLLVILSPLAFFAGIFDFGKAKEIYQKWWGHFISWSFIAVPAGFFLYLGHHLTTAISKGQMAMVIPSTANIIQRFFLQFSPYLISVIFLCIAFYLTLKVNAAGSQVIIGAANRAIKKTVALPSTLGKKLGQIAGTAAGSAVGAAAGGVVGGTLAARQQHIAAGKEAGKGVFARRIGATRAAFRGGLTKEGREEGRRVAEESREKLYGWAERHHLAPAGAYEEQREKRLAVEAAQKRGQKMSEERINAQLAVEATQPKHIAEQLGLIRAKVEAQHTLTARDKEILVRHGYLDGGKTIIDVLKARPDWATALKPDKAKEKEIERLVSAGRTRQQAETTVNGSQQTAITNEIARLRRANPSMSERKAKEQANLNVRMEAPHISQNVKIEMMREKMAIMTPRDFARNVQALNGTVIAGMNNKQREYLGRMGNEKQKQIISDIKKAGSQTKQEFFALVRDAHQRGDRAERDRLLSIVRGIVGDANFQ